MKLLASDYDETLYVNQTISQENLESIKTFQARGHKFGLCSGRHIDSLLEEISKFGIKVDFLIANNGTAVLNERFEMIKLCKIEQSLVQEAIDYFEREHQQLVYYIAANNGYTFGRRFFNDGCDFFPNHLVDISQITKGHVSTMFTQALRHEDAPMICQAANRYFKGRLKFYHNDPFIDINQIDVTKSDGVADIQQYYNLSFNHVYTIGDNLNDVEMLRDFQSFAVDHGLPVVKKTAKWIVKDVSQAINQIIKSE